MVNGGVMQECQLGLACLTKEVESDMAFGLFILRTLITAMACTVLQQ